MIAAPLISSHDVSTTMTSTNQHSLHISRLPLLLDGTYVYSVVKWWVLAMLAALRVAPVQPLRSSLDALRSLRSWRPTAASR